MENQEEYLYEVEEKNLAKRRKIAAALACGWTYERIAKELNVSTSTISSVKKKMRERGEI